MNEVKTLNEIRKIGIEALVKALGPVEMVRFIQSFDLGKGDYTKERSKWLDQTIEEITRDIKEKINEKQNNWNCQEKDEYTTIIKVTGLRTSFLPATKWDIAQGLKSLKWNSKL